MKGIRVVSFVLAFFIPATPDKFRYVVTGRAAGSGDAMRLGAWRQILLAHLTLAASLAATGCASPVNRNKQAGAAQRDGSQVNGLAQADEENRSAQPFEAASLRNPPSYDRPDGLGNPYSSPAYSPDLAQFSPQTSLERDMGILRESERRQEMMLREMMADPSVPPDALTRQEQMLGDTRKQIAVYNTALRQPDLNPVSPYGDMNSFQPDMSAMMERERIQAMAPPAMGGREFPPRSEVRMPRAATMDASSPFEQSGRFKEQSHFASSRAMQDYAQPETERVVYDPRRDGEFHLFAFPNTAADALSGAEGQPGYSAEAEEGERRILVPPGSVTPGRKPEIPNPIVVPHPASGQKPFAGATVGRPMFPPKQKVEMPDDQAPPPADLFSQSSASEEVQARPGLFSADGKVESSDWPEQKTQAGRPALRPPAQTKAPVNESAQREIQINSAQKQESSSRSEPGAKVERPVITIPTPSPRAKTLESRPAPQPVPSSRRNIPAPEAMDDDGSDDVFVPDMIFSR